MNQPAASDFASSEPKGNPEIPSNRKNDNENPVKDWVRENPASQVQLSPANQRIETIDLVRGVAVLGILTMNIGAFGLPGICRGNPTFIPGWAPLNIAIWWFIEVFFQGKMRALFSMLFGAGVVLLTMGKSGAGKESTPGDFSNGGEELADIYFRRTLWLVAIGCLHSTWLWEGDILFLYGMAGVVLFLFRRCRPLILFSLAFALMMSGMLSPVEAIKAMQTRFESQPASLDQEMDKDVTVEPKQPIEKQDDKVKGSKNPGEGQKKEIEERRGGYWKNYGRRSGGSHFTPFEMVPDPICAMLIGMGLFKIGFFSGSRTPKFYFRMMVMAYGLVLPLNMGIAVWSVATGFRHGETDLFWSIFYEPVRIAVALGHTCLVILLFKQGRFPLLFHCVGAVGRMALTNYLMQSLICTTIFYGYGLGWFGYLGYPGLLAVVAMVWLMELIWSPIWLRFFQFGPAEWTWRYLAYLRRPPLFRVEGEGI